jgi:hypothetical protein
MVSTPRNGPMSSKSIGQSYHDQASGLMGGIVPNSALAAGRCARSSGYLVLHSRGR